MTSEIVSEDVRAQIQERLQEIEAEHAVKILFAVESGSRAWGMHSPDSDYDVRFVYVHEPRWYLSIDQKRDVIECPIDGDLDLSGWDIKKALQLLVRGNCALYEWINSPVAYREPGETGRRMLDLIPEQAAVHFMAKHYFGLGEGNWKRGIENQTYVSIKKYLYVIRPAVILAWLRENSSPRDLPVWLPDQIAGANLPVSVSREIQALLRQKSAVNEAQEIPRSPVMDDFVQRQFSFARQSYSPPDIKQKMTELADDLFIDIVRIPF